MAPRKPRTAVTLCGNDLNRTVTFVPEEGAEVTAMLLQLAHTATHTHVRVRAADGVGIDEYPLTHRDEIRFA